MQKPKLSTIELVFVLIAASTLFTLTVYQMSTAGILPGNDPAVHLGKSATIVINRRVTYSTVPWYPPLFHTILAMLQILIGTIDVIVAAFILKMLIATLNVLMLLSTYLLCRKLFGTGPAVATSVFAILSVPLSEIIFWGGYANFLGLAYIAFIFYIMTKDMNLYLKMGLLVFGSFTIVMAHQLATFVFVLIFIPAFLASSTSGKKRKNLAYIGVIIGGGFALLAWYASILIQYSNMLIEHLFFAMQENVYNIPEVGLNALIRNNFGSSLFIALAGIPVSFIILKKKRKWEALILVFSWLGIPVLFSQSYLFGLYLPYNRFIYFFATPIAIFVGILTYNITKIPTLIEEKIVQNNKRKQTMIKVTKILALVTVISLFTLQGVFFLDRTETYPEFYERAPVSSYNSGLWIQHHSESEGTIVATRSPGSWGYIFSNQHTMEETNQLYSRNAVAESVLYSFYEMENSKVLTQEYTKVSSNAGQEVYVPLHNIWKRAVTMQNEKANVIYVDPLGKWVTIPLSETEETVYWTIKTPDETQLVSKYSHELFTAEKTVTFSSNSSVININWVIKAHRRLTNIKLEISNYMDQSLDFKEALVPGVLEWQNPWDNTTYVNENGHWALIEGNFAIMEGNTVAILDQTNDVLAVFELQDNPDWIIIGALENKFINLFGLRYELGYLSANEKQEISYSLFLCNSDFQDIKQFDASELHQQYDSTIKLEIQTIDYVTYIEEYDIKFVIVDTEKVLSGNEASPDLDRIYDNHRTVVYTTK